MPYSAFHETNMTLGGTSLVVKEGLISLPHGNGGAVQPSQTPGYLLLVPRLEELMEICYLKFQPF